MSRRRSDSRNDDHCEHVFHTLAPSQKILKFIDNKYKLIRALRPHTRSNTWSAWSPQENKKDYYAVLPPLDSYMGVNRKDALDHLWNSFEHGDLVIARLLSIRENGFAAVILALDGGKSRDVSLHKISVWCHVSEIPKMTNHEDVLLRFSEGDILRCVVIDVNSRDSEIVVSLKNQSDSRMTVPLGKIEDDELPLAYRRQLSLSEPLEIIMTKSVSFVNPNNVDYLMSRLKVPSNGIISLMGDLQKKHIPKEEYAEFLRKKQSKKVADKSVKKGVEKFRRNEYIEALQDFNYALDMDTENVDALVARGALYANRGSYSKAIQDFEGALKLESGHKNATKYLVEVLIERAKQIESQIEDVQQVKEAEKCYTKALQLDPNCDDAIKALGKIEQDRKNKEKEISSSSSDSESSLDDKNYAATAEKLRQILSQESTSKEHRAMLVSRRKSSHNGRRKELSSSSSSDESSSTTSSTSSSSSSSEDSRRKRRKRKSSSSSRKSKETLRDSTHSSRESRKAGSSKSKSPSRRKSKDSPSRKYVHSPKRKTPEKYNRDSVTRRKSSSSAISSDKKTIEKRRHSDISKTDSYHAIIHSKRSESSNFNKDRHKSPPVETKRGRQTSTNIANVTKDNFNDILKEISKFESTSKSYR